MQHRSSLPILLALMVAGCGAQVSAPSLAPRPVETQPILLPEAEREGAAAPAAGLGDRVAGLVRAAAAGDAAFARTSAQAERTVVAATGASQGSEPWTAAQEALSALVATRGPVRDAVASIEALRQDPANAGSGSRAVVEAAAARIETLDAGEAAAVARLSALLR